MSSFRLFSSRARQQSEPDVSPELREQIVNIVKVIDTPCALQQ